MFLLREEALVTVSSSSILFFKIDQETGLWVQYEKLKNIRGQISSTNNKFGASRI